MWQAYIDKLAKMIKTALTDDEEFLFDRLIIGIANFSVPCRIRKVSRIKPIGLSSRRGNLSFDRLSVMWRTTDLPASITSEPTFFTDQELIYMEVYFLNSVLQL